MGRIGMTTRWVSQSEAARLETEAGRPLAQSSVSRFLARNPDVPVQRNSSGAVAFVDYDALVNARRGSLAVQDSREARFEAPGGQERPPARSDEGSAATRKRAAEAELAEIGLAERKRELISRAAVQLAIQTAGLAFSQGLDRTRRGTAQRVAGIEDVRAVELALKERDRDLLNALVTALNGAAEGITAVQEEDDASAS